MRPQYDRSCQQQEYGRYLLAVSDGGHGSGRTGHLDGALLFDREESGDFKILFKVERIQNIIPKTFPPQDFS